MRSSALLSGLRPHPKTLYKGEAARGTIPVRPPFHRERRMPRILCMPSGIAVCAFLKTPFPTRAGVQPAPPQLPNQALCTELTGTSKGLLYVSLIDDDKPVRA